MNNTDISNDKIIMKKWRFRLVTSLVFIGLAAVVIKLFMIQIINRDNYRQAAENQHISQKELYAKRGDILDKNNKIITASHTYYTIAADPAFVKKYDEISLEMERITGKNKSEFLKKLKRKNTNYVKLASGIYGNQIDSLKKISDKGLIIIPQPKRIFIYGASLAQVIGLTNNQNVGSSGLEREWNEYLKGENGFITLNRDGRQTLRPAADLPVKPAKHGSSLKLTIDIELQNILEYELKQGVINSGSQSGTAVMMEPETGKILAMASYPGYNPNTGEGNIDENRRIRAITDTYEPGSTFKMIIAALAIDLGIVTEHSVYNAYNGYYAGTGFKIRDVHPFDKATFRDAIIHSSNIVFAQVANEVPDNLLYKYIRDFGFGITLGIELPKETRGSVKKPDMFTGVTKRYMGHGYELSVSPLQLTSAYAAIANKGNLMKPYLIEEIKAHNGRKIKEFKPEFIRKVISDTTAEKIAELFTAVVDSGTGKRAQIQGLKIAGKTGTAQQVVNGVYSNQHHTASFAGFFPADNPKIVMSIILDKPTGNYYGGTIAAPVFGNIASRVVTTDAYNINSVEDIPNDSLFIPDFFGIHTNEAEVIADNLGWKLEYEDEGYIMAQSPPSDMLMPAKSKIYLNVHSDMKPTDEYKPDLRGLSLSRAVQILSEQKVKVNVAGSGKVIFQKWKKDSDGNFICRLKAK